ncbi:hypothetical protein WME89_12255 [Sorangium sp. So ce321]|uniref:hypothetical protein n=1 Tax=Sorangium sp. So ce321 TaxID=3133300 RepID=UPI003F600E9E
MSTLLAASCASGASSATGVSAAPDAGAPAPRPPELLAFALQEGAIHNHFFRRGHIAAHLLVTSGVSPRLIVAFPAGNMGVAAWFDALPAPVELSVEGGVSGVERPGGMRGVSALLVSAAPALRVHRLVLGSIRTVREVGRDGELPAWLRADVEARSAPACGSIAVRRTTVDGEHHLELLIEPLDGATAALGLDGRVELAAGPRGLRFRVTALSDEAPLTPVPLDEIANERAGDDPRHRQALAFLTYREKLLAGSWRFLTYFGRDTLLAVRMLLPVLEPAVVEAALGSVLDRLSPEGEVAHEEAIGEYAALLRLAAGRGGARRESIYALREAGHALREAGLALREPVLDYKMVDDDFLLAPLAAEYLLGSAPGRARAAAFLARRTPGGEAYAQALARNVALVLRLAAPFAETREPRALIALKEGESVGEWRDSREGLAFGRIPYDVNVALVPAALRASARLLASPLLGAGPDDEGSARAERLARAWKDAGAFFRVELPEAEARRRAAAYAASLGIDPAPVVASLSGTLSFPAIALDGEGRPVPVMHSDDGFVLLFTDPSPEALEEIAGRLVRPFPAGLRTPVGILVANPAFAPDPAVRGLFTAGHYHGTVTWSWQQAMLAAGIDRQLARGDLSSTRARGALERARSALWEVIRASREASTWELWSWAVEGGRYRLVPFGAERAHHDESNAVQLWSTVYLAVRP